MKYNYVFKRPPQQIIKKKKICRRKNIRNPELKLIPLVEKLIQCDLCNYKVAKKESLHHHMKLKHTLERSECLICNKIFDNKFKLKTHMFNMHIESAMFECLICATKYKTYQKLFDHIEYTHSAQKRQITFICDLCGVDYYSKIHLDGHMKRVHCGFYKCFDKKCKASFSSRKNRKKHHLFFHCLDIKVK